MTSSEDRWLMLVHQLPAKPAYLRVKTWRRLQALGAVAAKGSVYVLPDGEQAREDFGWLLREVAAGGGEGFVCEARLVDGLADREVRGMFDRARGADYAELAAEARSLVATFDEAAPERRPETGAQLARLRARLSQVAAIDFFGADGREAVEGLLAAAGARLRAGEPAAARAPAASDLKGRTWVTRAGVHVDRIASAWLIRRRIDPEARFRFVDPRGFVPAPGELRFDMAEGEFTHEDDRCTFEVLLDRAVGPDDPALRAIAEIVHDIDLKDGKFGRPETEGVRAMIAGICATAADDEDRLARGAVLLDALDAHLGGRRP